MKQLTGMADLFGCGIAVALLLHDERVRRWAADRGRAAIGTASAAATVAVALVLYARATPESGDYFTSAGMYVAWPLLLALGCAGLVLFVQGLEPVARRPLRASGLAFLGVVSYSTYLMHPFVLQDGTKLWRRSGIDADPVLLVPLLLVAVVAASAVTYALVERPGMRLGRRLGLRGSGRSRP
jgi:peptidoglycan/LPS O-acetylase OafA/YrhL